MSSLQGYVHTTYQTLVEKLGEPSYIRKGSYSEPLDDSDGKVSIEFMTPHHTSEGFYVYDWKEEATPMGPHWWHIGGENIDALYFFEVATGLKAQQEYTPASPDAGHSPQPSMSR